MATSRGRANPRIGANTEIPVSTRGLGRGTRFGFGRGRGITGNAATTRPTINIGNEPRPRTNLTNTLSMGPRALVQSINNAQVDPSDTTTPDPPSGSVARQSRRLQTLRGVGRGAPSGPEPNQMQMDSPTRGSKITIGTSLNLKPIQKGTANPTAMLAMTPNSSTLLASPAGSSPVHGSSGHGGILNRRSRSRSNRRKSVLQNVTFPDGDDIRTSTPSRPSGSDTAAPLYDDPDSTADSSMMGVTGINPVKLELGGAGPDSSVEFTSMDSIDPEEDGTEYTEDESDEETEWGLVDRMRLWRHDAMTQHLYETAVFWGDKVMTWTNDPSDAFWLAQVHFQTGEYARAERLLTRPFPTKPAWDPHSINKSQKDSDADDTASALEEPSGFLFGTGGPQPYITPSNTHILHNPLKPSVPETKWTSVLPAKNKQPTHSSGYDGDPFLSGGSGLFSKPPALKVSHALAPRSNAPNKFSIPAAPVPSGSSLTHTQSEVPDKMAMLAAAASVTASASAAAAAKPTRSVIPPTQFDASFDVSTDQPLRPNVDFESMLGLERAKANPKHDDPATTAAKDGPLKDTREGGDLEMDLENGTEDAEPTVARLVDMSIMCRYLAAQCQVRQGKWAEALEVLGEENPFRDTGMSGPHVANKDGGIKLEASMCHLRGVLYMRLNRVDRAKQCFLEALALDVKCFEAFDTLIQCQMLTIDEEWALTQGLNYKEQAPDDAEFLQMMYTVRLKKLKHTDQVSLARRRLAEEYGLGDNCDLLYTLADSLYSQLRFADCFVVTSRIMDLTTIHLPTIPLHVACMYHLKHLHSRLFLLAHELVDKEPESPMSWYAVGIWYLAISKWREARQYLSKTTLMNPRHAPGWVAFAHTFAHEGEHEHAITAYSTCARLFQGSHLPYLFIGIERLMLSNISMASDALETSLGMCDSDPLVFNELGVVAYMKGEYNEAVGYFDKALTLAKIVEGAEDNWLSTYCNLGTSHRRLGNFAAAKLAYLKVLAVDPKHANALASIGMVHHMSGDYHEAIQRYHEALSVEPLDTNVLELLNMALRSGANMAIKVAAISEKVAQATQVMTEREGSYLKRAAEADEAESVGWDMPFGTMSAWSM